MTVEAQPPAMEPAIPLRLIIPSIDIDAEIYDHHWLDSDGAIDPRDRQSVAWWSGGGRPGANPDNTVKTSTSEIAFTTYLYAHSSDSPAVFNRIQENALKVGDEVIIETENGTCRYTVQDDVFDVSKPKLSSHPEAIKDNEGRLVLITCWRGSGYVRGTATDRNAVAIAQLDSCVTA